jgi:hypothetical protein
MVVAQGRASCLAPHLFAIEARPGRRLAARTWIRAPPRLPNTRSLTCQACSGVSRPPGPTVACAPYPSRSTTAAARWHSPSTPFHRAAQQETPPRWRGSILSTGAIQLRSLQIISSKSIEFMAIFSRVMANPIVSAVSARAEGHEIPVSQSISSNSPAPVARNSHGNSLPCHSQQRRRYLGCFWLDAIVGIALLYSRDQAKGSRPQVES